MADSSVPTAPKQPESPDTLFLSVSSPMGPTAPKALDNLPQESSSSLWTLPEQAPLLLLKVAQNAEQQYHAHRTAAMNVTAVALILISPLTHLHSLHLKGAVEARSSSAFSLSVFSTQVRFNNAGIKSSVILLGD